MHEKYSPKQVKLSVQEIHSGCPNLPQIPNESVEDIIAAAEVIASQGVEVRVSETPAGVRIERIQSGPILVKPESLVFKPEVKKN